MSAECTLLRDVKVIVEIDYRIRASIDARFAPSALLRVNYHYAIIPLVYCLSSTCLNAWRVITMLADTVEITDLYLGNSTSDHVDDFGPELTGVRLRLGIGCPVISHMLVLAGYLAVVASVTLSDIDNQDFTHFNAPLP
jgi:hypothetical protein